MSIFKVSVFVQSWKQTRRTRFSSDLKCIPDKHREPRDTDRQREKQTTMLFYIHYPLPLKTIQARIQSGLISLLPRSLHWANPPLSDQARPSSPSAFLKHSNHHSSHHLSFLYIYQPSPFYSTTTSSIFSPHMVPAIFSPPWGASIQGPSISVSKALCSLTVFKPHISIPLTYYAKFIMIISNLWSFQWIIEPQCNQWFMRLRMQPCVSQPPVVGGN